MSSAVTHFEIYGEQPERLAEFYRRVLGWQIEQMAGVAYWRIAIGTDGPAHLSGGGLSHRSIPGLNGWLLYVQVESVDRTAALVQELGGSVVRAKTAVPRTAWVTIVADPDRNLFGIWEPDPNAFPAFEPD